jgi:osmoprotectant transport system permease protein
VWDRLGRGQAWTQPERYALGDFVQFVGARWDRVLQSALEHAIGTLTAGVIAAVIGVTIGVLSYRHDRLRRLALNTSAWIMTIPSYALFVILVSLVMSVFWTAVIGLVMYAMLAIIRNTVTGLREVDPAVVESARGMGMTSRQVLWRIQLPLAWPVILTGLRVSTQITIGILAVVAVVGDYGLGRFIFQGLARIGGANDLNLALTGTLGIIVLAVLFDAAYAVLLRVTTPRGIRS